MLLSKINHANIDNYNKKLVSLGLAPATIKRRFSSVRRFCTWAAKEGYIDSNPFESPSPQERANAFSWGGKIKKPFSLFSHLPLPLPFRSLGVGGLNSSNKLRTNNQQLLTSLLPLLILLTLSALLSIGAYRQFFSQALPSGAYPLTTTPPNRVLSFQGRLTDTSGNPINAPTNFTFKLWNDDLDATEAACDGGGDENCLWSGACTLNPDTDGILSTLLGSDCGTEITQNVFSENTEVWLGVTVADDDEAKPRIQIATVAYALNTETLQGLPPGTGLGNILFINENANIGIGVTSPTLDASLSSGTFGITGPAISITTVADGNLTLAPDGSGVLNVNLSGAGVGSTSSQFRVTDANITTGNLVSVYARTNAAGFDLLSLSSGSTETEVFTVDEAGNTNIAGNLDIGGTATFSQLTTDGPAYLSSGVLNTETYLDETRGGTGLGGYTTGDLLYASGENTLAARGIGATGQVLTVSGGVPQWVDLSVTGGVSGSGTQYYLPRWASGSTLENGNLYDNGTFVGIGKTPATNPSLWVGANGNVGVGTTNPNEQLEITGNLRLPTSSSTTGIIKIGGSNFLHTYGTDNIFIGISAGNFTTSGSGRNTGIGSNTLTTLTTGHSNTALGYHTLDAITEGEYNTAMGSAALSANTTGSRNTAVGAETLQNNISGSFNTAIGEGTLFKNVSGARNVAIGHGVGSNVTAGTAPNYNVSVGYNSGYNLTGDYNIFLGYQAGYSETGSNKLYIENSNSATPLIWGDFNTDVLAINGNVGIGTTNPLYKLDVAGSLGVGTTATIPTLNLTGALLDKDGQSGSNTQILSSTGSATDWIDLSSVGLSGSGTENYVSKWLGSSTLGLSQIYDNGTFVGIGKTPATNPSLWVGANGNVGIGTTNPTGLLSLNRTYTGNTSGAPYTYHYPGYHSHIGIDPAGDSSYGLYYGSYHSTEVLGTNNQPIRNVDGLHQSLNLAGSGYVYAAHGINSNVSVTNPADNVKGLWSHNANYATVDNFFYGLQADIDSWAYNTYASDINNAKAARLRIQNTTLNTASTAGANINSAQVIYATIENESDSGTYDSHISTATGIQYDLLNYAGGVIGTSYGINISTPVNNGTITNHYGLYLGDQAGVGASNSFAIYSDGGTNYLAGNLGIGTTSPAYKLHVVGDGYFSTALGVGTTATIPTLNLTGVLLDGSGNAGSSGQVLSSIGTGTSWVDMSASGIGGSGTANYLPKFTAGTTLGNSVLYETGGNVGIGTTDPLFSLDIYGHLRIQGGEAYLSGITSSASTTEGTIYYDTDDDQLKVYSNGKWQSDRTTATVIVGTANGSGASVNYEKADYVCDGTDDQVEIEQALAALPSDGGIVIILEGTYNLTEEINITGSNITIAGTGSSTILKKAWNETSTNVGLITLNTSLSYVTVKDMFLDGEKATYSNSSYNHGIHATTPQHCTFTNLWITDFAARGLSITSTSGDVTGNSITANHITENNIGVRLFTSSSYMLTENVISNNVLKDNTDNHLFIDNNNANSNNIISDNTFEGSSNESVEINSADGGILSNNSFTSSGSHAVYMTNSADRWTITGNAFSDNAYSGINLDTGNHNLISNNSFYNNGGSSLWPAIRIHNDSDSNVITSNRIVDTAGTSSAIYIEDDGDDPDNNYLADNYFSGTGATYIRDEGTGTIFGGQLADTDANNFLINPIGNVGIGTTSPAYKLHVVGDGYFSTNLSVGQTVSTATLSLSGALLDSAGMAGSSGQVLSSIGTGTSWVDMSASGIGGSGTLNYLAKWSPDGSTLANSQIFDNSTFVGIGGTAAATNPRLYIAADTGFVGVGTTTPLSPLHVTVPEWTFIGEESQNVIIGTSDYGDGIRLGYNFTSNFGIISVYQPGVMYGNLILQNGGGNVGIGTTSPAYKLDVVGSLGIGTTATIPTLNLTGALLDSAGSAGSSGQVLSSIGTGTSWVDMSASGIGGSGTANYLPKFTAGTTLGNSVLYETGGNVGIGTTTPGAKLAITGDLLTSGNLALNSASLDSSYGINLGTFDDNGERGINQTVSADTDGDYVYGLYQTVNTGSGTLSSDHRYAIGIQNDISNQASTGNSKYPFVIGIKNTLNDLSGASYTYGVYNQTPTGTTLSGELYGYTNYIAPTTINSGASVRGLNNRLYFSTGSGGDMYGVFNDIYSGSAADQNVYGVYTSFRTEPGDIAYGYVVDDSMTGGMTTGGIHYGLYLNMTDTDATRYGLYETAGVTNYLAGNLGIGTTSPDYKLHVVGDGFFENGNPNIYRNDGQDLFIRYDGDVNGIPWAVGVQDSKNGAFMIAQHSDLSTNQLFIIDDVRNVGIGTTSPSEKLDVNGNLSVNQSIKTSSGHLILDPATSAVLLYDNANNFWLRGYNAGTIGFQFVGSGTNYITSGNVGIGTTSPAYKLHVVGDGYFSTNLSVGQTVSTATLSLSGALLDSAGMAGSSGQVLSSIGTGTSWVDMSASGIGGSGTANYLPKFTAGTTLGNSVLYETGNYLGIGTTNPLSHLHVLSYSASGTSIRIDSGDGEITSGEILGYLEFYASRDHGGQKAMIQAVAESAFSSSNSYTGLAFHTNRTDGSISEKVRINSDGYVGIGTTTPTETLDVAGTARVRTLNSGTYNANLNVTSTGVLTTNTSDAFFKTNVTTIDNALDKILRLRGVTFNWKDQTNPRRMTGMIAQEVQTVMPELVFQNPTDGYLGINYGEAGGLLIEGIKEQQNQITGLQNNLDDLASDLYLTDIGNLSITSTETGGQTIYEIQNDSGTVIDRIGAFSNALVAELTAGIVRSRELFAARRIVSPLVETGQLISPIVETDEVRIKNQELSIKNNNGEEVANFNANGESGFGRLIADQGTFGNLLANEVQTNSLSAQSLTTNHASASELVTTGLLADEATVSGTLFAGKIIADEIVGLEGRFGDLLATNTNLNAGQISGLEDRLAELEAVQSAPSPTPTHSTPSVEPTMEPSPAPTPEKDGLVFPETDPADLELDPETEALVNQILASSADTGTQADMSGLTADDLTIKNTLTVLGATSLADTTVSGSLNIGGTLSLADNSINSLTGTLYLQNLGMGGIDILAGKITIDPQGNLFVQNNLTVAGTTTTTDLTVAEEATVSGSLFAQILHPVDQDITVVLDPQMDSDTGEFRNSKFEIRNSDGNEVAAVDSSGHGSFRKLLIADAADPVVPISATEVTTNATAGKATLAGGQTELVIRSAAVTDQTLIYVTPTTSTQNQVLYVAAKKAAEYINKGLSTEALAKEGWFKVAVDTPISQNIDFNWWIIN